MSVRVFSKHMKCFPHPFKFSKTTVSFYHLLEASDLAKSPVRVVSFFDAQLISSYYFPESVKVWDFLHLT